MREYKIRMKQKDGEVFSEKERALVDFLKQNGLWDDTEVKTVSED